MLNHVTQMVTDVHFNEIDNNHVTSNACIKTSFAKIIMSLVTYNHSDVDSREHTYTTPHTYVANYNITY